MPRALIELANYITGGILILLVSLIVIAIFVELILFIVAFPYFIISVFIILVIGSVSISIADFVVSEKERGED